jgi:hypothetical protein
MTRESPRELASALDDLSDAAGGTATQAYVDELLASSGWDFNYDDDPDGDDRMVQVLDCDGWAMFVERGDIPATIDIETLPVTSV